MKRILILLITIAFIALNLEAHFVREAKKKKSDKLLTINNDKDVGTLLF